ncbi:MAG: hypothetical protein WB019_09045, partial [Pseudolabrys sp.]
LLSRSPSGNKTRDAALGGPRIRAGEIIGWRFWKLCNGLLHSVIVSYTWHPAYSSDQAPNSADLRTPGIRDKEQAEREALMYGCWWPAVIGSVAMWGEVIEHEQGWRSEYAAVRSIIKITGNIRSKHWLLRELREKYRCTDSDRTLSDAAVSSWPE